MPLPARNGRDLVFNPLGLAFTKKSYIKKLAIYDLLVDTKF